MLASLVSCLSAAALQAGEPGTSSWNTEKAAQCLQIDENTAAEAAGTSSTTWSRGQDVQNNPIYAGIHEIACSDDWVCIRTTGLGPTATCNIPGNAPAGPTDLTVTFPGPPPYVFNDAFTIN